MFDDDELTIHMLVLVPSIKLPAVLVRVRVPVKYSYCTDNSRRPPCCCCQCCCCCCADLHPALPSSCRGLRNALFPIITLTHLVTNTATGLDIVWYRADEAENLLFAKHHFAATFSSAGSAVPAFEAWPRFEGTSRKTHCLRRRGRSSSV